MNLARAELRKGSPQRESLAERVARLARETAIPGWDDARGAPISTRSWDRAARLIEVASHEVASAPVPYVGPSGDGTVILRWATATASVDAELSEAEIVWDVEMRGVRGSGESTSDADVIDLLRKAFGA